LKRFLKVDEPVIGFFVLFASKKQEKMDIYCYNRGRDDTPGMLGKKKEGKS